MLRNLEMAGLLKDVDVVHCHTWYTHLAGCLVKQLTGARLVLTTHSLEPHRPWKVEQLGTAYNASSWVERTAYQNADGVIAVSASMREDVHDALRRGSREDPGDPQRDRPEPVPADAQPGRPRQVRDRPRPALRAVRRPDHPAEGDHPPGRGDQIDPPRGAGRPVRGGRRTRRRSAGRWPSGSSAPGSNPRTRSSGFPRSCPRTRSSRSTPTPACSPAPRCTSRSGSSTWRRWPAGRRWWPRRSGGSSRWSSRARPACSCPSTPKAGPTSSRRTPPSFAGNLAGAINKLLDDPDRLKEMGARSRERVEHFFSWTSIARWTMDFYWDLVQA